MENAEVPMSASTFDKVRTVGPGLGILGDLLLKVCYPLSDLESRFYAVFSKAASKWPSVKTSPDRSPGTETAKGRESVRISRKDRNGVLLRLAGI